MVWTSTPSHERNIYEKVKIKIVWDCIWKKHNPYFINKYMTWIYGNLVPIRRKWRILKAEIILANLNFKSFCAAHEIPECKGQIKVKSLVFQASGVTVTSPATAGGSTNGHRVSLAGPIVSSTPLPASAVPTSRDQYCKTYFAKTQLQ